MKRAVAYHINFAIKSGWFRVAAEVLGQEVPATKDTIVLDLPRGQDGVVVLAIREGD